MQILFLGPPGSGKGTQSKRLAERVKITYFASGDIFRQAMENNTPLGQEVKEYMDSGKLVPDSILLNLFTEVLSVPDSKHGFILDGFPRTLDQAEGLDLLLQKLKLPLSSVIYLQIPDEAIIERMAGRRICPNKACNAVYNLKSSPPKVENICDRCGTTLVQRDDDKPEILQKRLAVYHTQTEPLVAYYEKKAILHTVDAQGNPDLVFSNIMKALQVATK
jgi:adenylate kinase